MSVDALTRLANALQPFRSGVSAAPSWSQTQALNQLLAQLRERYRARGDMRREDRVLATVEAFLRTGKVMHPDEVFALCLGAGWLDARGHGILADDARRETLLTLAATLTGRKRRLKAYRNLLFAYWSFPLYDAATSTEAVIGWQALRAWLRARLPEIERHPTPKPLWFTALAAHRNLLDDAPCAPYADALLAGRFDDLQQASDRLAIPAASWLRQAALLARIDAACARPDASFLALLPGLLALAQADGETRITAPLTRRIIGQLLVRYTRLGDADPQDALFQLAVERIGNPWRNRAQWDSDVRREDGSPCSTSREMVAGWLKEHMVETFFTGIEAGAERSALWRRYTVFMQALTVAQPWGGRRATLLAAMGRFIVRIPQDHTATADVHPWQLFVMRGGAKLLDADTVDGMAAQRIFDKCPPVANLSQDDLTASEATLRGLLFAASR